MQTINCPSCDEDSMISIPATQKTKKKWLCKKCRYEYEA